ncbi:hypothetical protein BDQ17DRAFT_1235514 [Cyathus striatus]|nr:hypothetical protein BDQ17DRAFT_1235514 [Cyathus striatus]
MRSASPSSSSSSSSSRTPSPEPLSTTSKTKAKAKATPKSKTTTDPAKSAKYEESKAYVPPPDMELQSDVVDAGEFDWDTINGDKDTELWLIRVPQSVKPKHLAGTPIHPSLASKTTRIGTLNRKHATFDIWNVGDEDDKETPVGGEEIKSLHCLLPRKSKKGLLYPAPKPITRHILVSAQTVEPTHDAEKTGPQTYQNPPRPSYAKELLKHKFMPIGSLVGGGEVEEVMDVDFEVPPPSPKKEKKDKKEKEKEVMDVDFEAPPPSPKKEKKEKEKEKEVMSKGKKRKGEDGGEATPAKKAKKSKA